MSRVYPSIRSLLTSNIVLAMVAGQVFFQVWVAATGWPVVGLILNFWISWRLGCLAGHADLAQLAIRNAQTLLDRIQAKQAWFESLPPDERVEQAEDWADWLQWMTSMHQYEIDKSQSEFENPTLRELWEWTFGSFSRRRQIRELTQ